MTNYAVDPVAHPDPGSEAGDNPVSIAQIARILRRYAGVIVLTLGSVGILYNILAVMIYLFAPAVRTTTLGFRLEFEGASSGVYPNGKRFSSSEIIATPVLRHVFDSNDLGSFLKFSDFSRSIVVLESNSELERLTVEYRARLSDTKLDPVDRERIEKEFEQKSESLSKHEYAITYIHSGRRIPERVVRKVLVDTLNRWAYVATMQQHVLKLQASVLSPNMVTDPAIQQGDLIMGLQVLRARLWRVAWNIREIQQLPGAAVAKTPDQLSLEEVAIRIEEAMRFRLEPLVASVRASDVGPSTLQFLKNALTYDERQLAAATKRSEAIRQTLAVYSRDQAGFAPSSSDPNPATKIPTVVPETIMPQLSDSFLDRLVALTSESADTRYRQRLTDDYRYALQQSIPLEEAVAYDRQIIAQLETGIGGARDSASVRADLAALQMDLKRLVEKVNELYQITSRNIFPTSEMLTVTSPPVSRVERAVSLSRLALLGILVMLIALPATFVGVLLHNRANQSEMETIPATDTVHPMG